MRNWARKTVVMKIFSFLLFVDYTKLGKALITSGFENASVCDAAKGT